MLYNFCVRSWLDVNFSYLYKIKAFEAKKNQVTTTRTSPLFWETFISPSGQRSHFQAILVFYPYPINRSKGISGKKKKRAVVKFTPPALPFSLPISQIASSHLIRTTTTTTTTTATPVPPPPNRNEEATLFLLLLLPFTFAEIKNLKISSDSRAHDPVRAIRIHAHWPSNYHRLRRVRNVRRWLPDPSRLGFFLLSEESLIQVLLELQSNPSFCVLDSNYIHLLFTFRDLSRLRTPRLTTLTRSLPRTRLGNLESGFPVGGYYLLLCDYFPIVWSIRSLRETSKTDGKAARNLAKLTLFRQFYIVVIGYLYFTRIVVFALRTIAAYKYQWVANAAEEIASLAFYAIIFYMFRPVEKNEYFALDDEEEEAAELALKDEESTAKATINNIDGRSTKQHPPENSTQRRPRELLHSPHHHAPPLPPLPQPSLFSSATTLSLTFPKHFTVLSDTEDTHLIHNNNHVFFIDIFCISGFTLDPPNKVSYTHFQYNVNFISLNFARACGEVGPSRLRPVTMLKTKTWATKLLIKMTCHASGQVEGPAIFELLKMKPNPAWGLWLGGPLGGPILPAPVSIDNGLSGLHKMVA
ncbi:hypothetical protein DH2020_025918 [Rehmannia glutinosa]|uniref:Uncharacterized protein n=1 Tax=Rehmannia glutinosa TaxID=99300 RepID=A0ABR0VYF7_REHGL